MTSLDMRQGRGAQTWVDIRLNYYNSPEQLNASS